MTLTCVALLDAPFLYHIPVRLCPVSGEDVPEQQAGWGKALRAAAGSWHRRALRSLPHGAALLPAPCLQPASCSASLRRQRFPSPVLKARVPPSSVRAPPGRQRALRCRGCAAGGRGLRVRSRRCGARRSAAPGRGVDSALPPAVPPAPRDAHPGSAGRCEAAAGIKRVRHGMESPLFELNSALSVCHLTVLWLRMNMAHCYY